MTGKHSRRARPSWIGATRRAGGRDEHRAPLGAEHERNPPPLDERYFVSTEALRAALAKVSKIDYERFKADIDAYVDQDPTPRFWDES